VTDQWVSKLSGLTVLDLRENARISNAALLPLVNITDLNITDCVNISVQGLNNMQKLKILEVGGSDIFSQVPKEIARCMKRDRPNVLVVYHSNTDETSMTVTRREAIFGHLFVNNEEERKQREKFAVMRSKGYDSKGNRI
jgi:hypothetical protein